MQSWAEIVAAAVSNDAPLTEGQRNLLITELAKPKYAGLPTAVKLFELSKSETLPGLMPRQYCTPVVFMVVRSRASKAACSPQATVQQKAVWAQFGDASLGMGNYDAVDLTLPDVRGGLDACLATGLISPSDYNSLLWEDSIRTAGWVERTFGAGYVLLPSDLEGLV